MTALSNAAQPTWLTSSQSTKRKIRFVVMVLGLDERKMPTRTVISNHAHIDSALLAAANVVRQWAASHGAIRPGTRVVISDRDDGAKVFGAEYLGFEEDLHTEGVAT